jgi:xanthine dehydrogenase small subunit
VAGEGGSLLEALREDLGVRSVKDGCSPQGQCGCCTVLVDGSPRVACVTPLRRVSGRAVTTVDGLDPATYHGLVNAFVAAGASQCGFCTPGILCRLAALGASPTPAQVETALLAHLCRCTGWRTIVEAACSQRSASDEGVESKGGQLEVNRRATIEGGVPQRTGPGVVVGRGGFADDLAPPDSLVAVPDGKGGWALGASLAEARAQAARVPGRRSGRQLQYPVDLPEGDWDLTWQTTWVEPAYLELDASWCVPGGQPVPPAANGGAFGGKASSIVAGSARELADRYGKPVRVVFSREDVVRYGPKRPPMAAGARLDGTGIIRVASAPGIVGAIRRVATRMQVEAVSGLGGAAGPPVSGEIRAAGWAEAAVLLAALDAMVTGRVPGGEPSGGQVRTGEAAIKDPDGGTAEARVTADGSGWPTAVEIVVACGDPLDDTVLRSYAIGAAHMALGWVCSEAIAVGEDGTPEDLTVRSFGVLRARDTPPINVHIQPGPVGAAEPVRGSDAVFAAVAAATWIAQGLPPRWPTRRERIT